MDKQRRDAKELVKNLPLKDKIKHFWYYYKVHIISITLAAILIITTTVQCMRQIKYDMNVSYYSIRYVENTNLDAFCDILEEATEDINNNGSVDVYLSFFSGDITTKLLDQNGQIGYQKIQVELASDEYQSYILDEAYLEMFTRLYPDAVETVTEIGNIPDVKETLGLFDNEKLYLVTTPLFERSKDDEEKLLERKNALNIKEFFEKKQK